MVSRLNSSKFCRQDADCCSELLLAQKSEKSKSIQIISMHLLETRTSLYIIFRYYMILYNDWFIDVIILSLSFALWISPPRSCWQLTGGWWACCPGTSSYAAAFIATDTGGAVAGVKRFNCTNHINMITMDHQSPYHVWSCLVFCRPFMYISL